MLCVIAQLNATDPIEEHEFSCYMMEGGLCKWQVTSLWTADSYFFYLTKTDNSQVFFILYIKLEENFCKLALHFAQS